MTGEALRLLLGDLLVGVGLLTLTLALVGFWRFPGLRMRLHATAKIGSLGLVAILLATPLAGDGRLVARALLIAVFLVLTAPVATHVLGSAEARQRRSGGGNGCAS